MVPTATTVPITIPCEIFSLTSSRAGTYFTPAGFDVRVGFRQLGASRTPVLPLALADGELAVFPTDGQTSTRLATGLNLGLGAAFNGPKLRLDMAWTVAGRLMPPAPGVEHHEEPEAGWLWLATGPQIGLTVYTRKGPAPHFAVTAQGSFLDLEGVGESRFRPWVGLVGGAEFPVRKRR